MEKKNYMKIKYQFILKLIVKIHILVSHIQILIKRNLFKNNFENFFSGSENSYSSTYNSSNRTKFISEKNIKNYPLLNYDKSAFHRFQTGIELMTNNKNNYINKKSVLKKINTCESQSMKNLFLNTNYLDKEKKKNLNKITSDNNLINKKKYFNSRNEKLNVPVKLIKFNQENKIPFYNTSSYNSSIINENEQRHSMEISYTNNESLSKLNLRQLKKIIVIK